jgi:hypothetical protein
MVEDSRKAVSHEQEAAVILEPRHEGGVEMRRRDAEVREERHGVLEVLELAPPRLEERLSQHETGEQRRQEGRRGGCLEHGAVGAPDERGKGHLHLRESADTTPRGPVRDRRARSVG